MFLHKISILTVVGTVLACSPSVVEEAEEGTSALSGTSLVRCESRSGSTDVDLSFERKATSEGEVVFLHGSIASTIDQIAPHEYVAQVVAAYQGKGTKAHPDAPPPKTPGPFEYFDFSVAGTPIEKLSIQNTYVTLDRVHVEAWTTPSDGKMRGTLTLYYVTSAESSTTATGNQRLDNDDFVMNHCTVSNLDALRQVAR